MGLRNAACAPETVTNSRDHANLCSLTCRTRLFVVQGWPPVLTLRSGALDGRAQQGAEGLPQMNLCLAVLAMALGCLVGTSVAQVGSNGGATDVNGTGDSCALVVVGAGAGGLYAAWRLVTEGVFAAEQTCIFEKTSRVGGRAYSVRGDDLPPELVAIGANAVDVGAYRASSSQHPILASLWGDMGIQTGCYQDAAFRTGDCTGECDRPTVRYVRDVHIDHDAWLNSSENSPYRFSVPWGKGQEREAPLSPFHWLVGPQAPDFVTAELEELSTGKTAAIRWAARNRILKAASGATLDGVPATQASLMHMVRNGVGGSGLKMTQEDLDFYLDSDCGSAGAPVALLLNYYELVARSTADLANGLGLGLGGGYSVPIDPATGSQIGFATQVEVLAERLAALGVDVQLGEELVGVELHDDSKALTLTFASGLEVTPAAAVLNIPPDAFEAVVRREDVRGPKALPHLGRWLDALERVPALKAYVYYDDAFWAQPGLNRTGGRMRTSEELYNSRYHDGFVRCDDNGACKGILLAQYASGDRGAPWAGTFFQDTLDNPYVQIRRNSSDPRHVQFLDELHRQLMLTHAVELERAGLNASEIVAPDVALVGVFLGRSLYGWHGRRPSSLEPGQFDEVPMEPFPGYGLHLVNEAYGPTTGWMESSLVSAERMVSHMYGLEKPAFLTEENAFEGFDPDLYYEHVIRNFTGR
ncbi:unnamed protein product [Ostreobium quekettii]|uniref:Amine oxidase domain-containing protein n=1 Tax=Ostreobium quekettii TaxID=121088 RepID=A0A8S1ISB5_9CHLO|nr:unnamed protein product [Ostreobium quekettii]